MIYPQVDLVWLAVVIVAVWTGASAERDLRRAGAVGAVRAAAAVATGVVVIGAIMRGPALVALAAAVAFLGVAIWRTGYLARCCGGPLPAWKALREKDRVETARLEALLTGSPLEPIEQRIRQLSSLATPETIDYLEAYQRLMLDQDLSPADRRVVKAKVEELGAGLRRTHRYDAWRDELNRGNARIRELDQHRADADELRR